LGNTNRSSAAPVLQYQQLFVISNKDSPFIIKLYTKAPFKHRGIAMATEIENLRARKETVKTELQAEEQKEKSLQEDIQILEEKIEIRDLEKKLEARRESVKQLESRKSELQEKWNQPTQDMKKDEEPKKTPSQLMVNVEPASNPAPIQSDETSAQKKRRFF
jgi:chromosome segregation ATPase